MAIEAGVCQSCAQIVPQSAMHDHVMEHMKYSHPVAPPANDFGDE